MTEESPENIVSDGTASPEDTIIAPATPPGRSALAVVRMSGKLSRTVAENCLRSRSANPLQLKPRAAKFGKWVHPESGEVIDEVVVTLFADPASYTGEDLVEISCHGSSLMVSRIMNSCLTQGVRPARPGEFTERAFLNGKIDLTRAQAVAEVIDASTQTAQRHAVARLAGGLERKVLAVEDKFLSAAALIEAYLDFPEDDVGVEDQREIDGYLNDGMAELGRLLATWQRGHLEAEGLRVVLAGEPNVGKSSLFNALLGKARALVTPIAGTTRDTIDAQLDLGGVPVRLIDTAGLRSTDDEVERLGVERSHDEIRQADAVLWLFEAHRPLEDQRLDHLVEFVRTESDETSRETPRLLIVLNQDDKTSPDELTKRRAKLKELGLNILPLVTTSAITEEKIPRFIEELELFLLGEGQNKSPSHAELLADSVVVADLAQKTLLDQALQSARAATAAIQQGTSGDLVMVDLQDSLDNLAEITGTSASEEKLDRIFRRFCLGK
jgi:tRNA modification GTPase